MEKTVELRDGVYAVVEINEHDFYQTDDDDLVDVKIVELRVRRDQITGWY